MKTLLICLSLFTAQCVSPPHLPPAESLLPQHYTEPDEVHFPCYVIEWRMTRPGHWESCTECGVIIESETRYNVGDTLKGFISPKHK